MVEEGDSATLHCNSSNRVPVWWSGTKSKDVYKSYKYHIKIALFELEGYYYCRGVTASGRSFVARAKLEVTGTLSSSYNDYYITRDFFNFGFLCSYKLLKSYSWHEVYIQFVIRYSSYLTV